MRIANFKKKPSTLRKPAVLSYKHAGDAMSLSGADQTNASANWQWR